MDAKDLNEKAQELIDSIDLCYSCKLFTPSLILLYSAIDIMASLDRETSHDYVLRCDFLAWVDTYILPYSTQRYNSIDLYAARCSLIHSYSAESRLSNNEEAAKLYYAQGPKKKKDLQEMIDRTKEPNTKAIDSNELIGDTKKGIERFLIKKGNNKLILKRAGKLFTSKPLPMFK
ncbi:MAG: hypothetical protein ACTSQD_02765 [Promethearchaeota archaeon]